MTSDSSFWRISTEPTGNIRFLFWLFRFRKCGLNSRKLRGLSSEGGESAAGDRNRNKLAIPESGFDPDGSTSIGPQCPWSDSKRRCPSSDLFLEPSPKLHRGSRRARRGGLSMNPRLRPSSTPETLHGCRGEDPSGRSCKSGGSRR